VIASTTAVYTEHPVAIEDRLAWLTARHAAGFPVIGAFIGERLIGYGSFGDFRPWACYRNTVEHSVHVAADCRGRGAGKMIVGALIDRAAALGKHVMIAGIDSENRPSLALHAALGFVEVGRLPAVGRKFGRWLDLVYCHRSLPAG